jgi:hypothetical protein
MKEDEKTTTVVASTTTSSDKSFDSVVVHPLVLLSVVDHYKRVDEVRARFSFSPRAISFRVFSLFGFSMRGFVARASKSDWFCALVLRSLSLVPFLSRVRVFIVETHIARVLSLSLSLIISKGR